MGYYTGPYGNATGIPPTRFYSRISKKRPGSFLSGGQAHKILKEIASGIAATTRGANAENELTSDNATVHNGIGKYFINIKLQARKKKYERGALTSVNHTYPFSIVANAGKQSWGPIARAASNSSFTTVGTNGSNFDLMAQPLFNLVRDSEIGTGGIYTGASGSRQIYLQSMVLELSMTNLSNSGVELELYVNSTKRSTNLTGQGAANEGLSDQRYNQDPAAFGGAGIVEAAPGADTMYHLYSKPQSAEKFQDVYRIMKFKRIMMGAGSSASVKIMVYANQIWDERVTREEKENGFNYAGPLRTVEVMAIARGSVVQDETGTNTATTATVDIRGITNCKYNLREVVAMEDAGRLTYRHQPVATDVVVTNQKHMGNADVEISGVDV